MSPSRVNFAVIVIGGGHAGAEAAWAAANVLAARLGPDHPAARVALLTMNPATIGAMSCNPAIGGLAKGQMVREIDALGGLMGLAADATGLQFRILNASKGPAVRGPRCQSDKYAYARQVRQLLATRPNLDVLAGTVERFIVEGGHIRGLLYSPRLAGGSAARPPASRGLYASSIVLTTGTFMRGLMHTGPRQTPGGRVHEPPATGISAELQRLGFTLGRLKTGTPPRLDGRTIDFASLEAQPGDEHPLPFSELTPLTPTDSHPSALPTLTRFPLLDQRPCHLTRTTPAIHDLIRDNLDRAPMYNGSIETAGPRYCPSIEDKVVRFADRTSHHVFLEPESLETQEVYCNGISTSLPADVQEQIVAQLPGCEHATILRPGYAVEYDMVPAHQIDATTGAKGLPGLFLAGQINGTTGYEEAAAQGLLAGLNAARLTLGDEPVRLRRDQAYLGVLMDDLVTKTPVEPYRMFTSRAEHRLLLRSDNADHRLTPLGREWGLVDDERWERYEAKREEISGIWNRGSGMSEKKSTPSLASDIPDPTSQIPDLRVAAFAEAEQIYAGYLDRQQREVEQLASREEESLPHDFDYDTVTGLRKRGDPPAESLPPRNLRPGPPPRRGEPRRSHARQRPPQTPRQCITSHHADAESAKRLVSRHGRR